MCIFELAYYFSIFFLPIIVYWILYKNKPQSDAPYSTPDWYYFLKYHFAKRALTKLQNARKRDEVSEECQKITSEKFSDSMLICGVDPYGNYSLIIKIVLYANRTAQVYLNVTTQSGGNFEITENGVIPMCSIKEYQWCANGLQIAILEPFKRLKITYKSSGAQKIEQMTLIWSATSATLHHPRDASTHLLTQAIATERWRDGNWVKNLGDELGYEQYGFLHGLIKLEGSCEENLRLDSWRKRFWGTREDLALRRDFFVFGTAEDGVLFNAGARSLKNGCTQLKYGSVRFADGEISPIETNDLQLGTLAENGSLPKAFLINFKAKSRRFRCVVHLLGVPSKNSSIDNNWELVAATADCDINATQAKSAVFAWYAAINHSSGLEAVLLKATPPRNEWGRYELLHEFDSPKSTTEITDGALLTALTRSVILETIEKHLLLRHGSYYYCYNSDVSRYFKTFAQRVDCSIQFEKQPKQQLFSALISTTGWFLRLRKCLKDAKKLNLDMSVPTLPFDTPEEVRKKIAATAGNAAILFSYCLKTVEFAYSNDFIDVEGLGANAVLQQFELDIRRDVDVTELVRLKRGALDAGPYRKLGSLQRLMYKILLDETQACVQICQSIQGEVATYVKTISEAYLKLSRCLIDEDASRNASYVFHLTEYELKQLIKTKSLSLIEKALKREEMHRSLLQEKNK